MRNTFEISFVQFDSEGTKIDAWAYRYEGNMDRCIRDLTRFRDIMRTDRGRIEYVVTVWNQDTNVVTTLERGTFQ